MWPTELGSTRGLDDDTLRQVVVPVKPHGLAVVDELPLLHVRHPRCDERRERLQDYPAKRLSHGFKHAAAVPSNRHICIGCCWAATCPPIPSKRL